jgi:hypothetical protein
MVPKNKRRIAKAVSLVVSLAGVLVMIGWIFDISILKSIFPAWVSMKFDTAITFLLSGITLYFIIRAVEGEFDKAPVALCITTLIIILLMGILFFSALLGIHTGAESLFIQEAAGAVKTVTPGRPSVPTMLNFVLIALAGILTMLNPEKVPLRLKIIGYVVGTIGVLAIVGYIINAPLLYYFIEGKNSAMACHTAILFVLFGTGLLCLSD